MADQLELIREANAPDMETLKRLRVLANRAHGPDRNLDEAVATAFGLPDLAPSERLADGLQLLKRFVPDWSYYKLEGYAENAGAAEYEPEGYFFELSAEYSLNSDPQQTPVHPTPELAALRIVLDHLVRAPDVKKRREAEAAAKLERPAAPPVIVQEEEDPSEAEEAPPKVYPETLAGYVESWADWLDRMDQGQIEDPYDFCDAETKAAISKNYQTCIGIMKRQAKAITIIEDMLEAEAAKNPSPRMKALQAAIEAIYRD